MIKTNILIVEDEFLIGTYLKSCLVDASFNVVDIVVSYDEAINVLEIEQIDIVLIDINLFGPKTGIDLANTINQKYKLPFIYLTSYTDDHTLTELKKTFPKGFISKPVNDKDLVTMISIVNNNRFIDERDNPHISGEEKLSIKDSILVKKSNVYHKIVLKDVLYIKVDGIYSNIQTHSGSFLSSKKLVDYEKILPSKKFVRTHRSCIMNLDHMVGLDPVDSVVIMSNNDALPLSRTQKQILINNLNIG